MTSPQSAAGSAGSLLRRPSSEGTGSDQVMARSSSDEEVEFDHLVQGSSCIAVARLATQSTWSTEATEGWKPERRLASFG